MGKAQAAAAKVCGISADKLDAAAISNGLEHFKIASGKATIERRVEMLVAKFAEIDKAPPPGVKIVVCENCDAESTNDLDVCPFCGVGEDDAAQSKSSVEHTEDEIPDPEEDATDPDIEEDEVPSGDAEVDGSSMVDPGEAIAEPDVDVTPAVLDPALAAPVAEEQKMTQVKGKNAKKSAKKSAALAVVAPTHEGVLEDARLAEMTPFDRSVAEIKQIQRIAGVSGYMLAKKLAETEMSGVWKTKLNAKQKPEYTNFDAYAHIELGLSGKYVRTMLKLFSRFTEVEIRTIPVTKLRLAMEVDADAQPNVMQQIKEGASRREIERSMGRMNRDTQGSKGKSEDKPKPSTSGKVTLALVEQKQKFVFIAKPAKKGDAERPAKRIGETPWARLPISTNDVEVLLTVTTNARGEFVGTVEVRRVDPVK